MLEPKVDLWMASGRILLDVDEGESVDERPCRDHPGHVDRSEEATQPEDLEVDGAEVEKTRERANADGDHWRHGVELSDAYEEVGEVDEDLEGFEVEHLVGVVIQPKGVEKKRGRKFRDRVGIEVEFFGGAVTAGDGT